MLGILLALGGTFFAGLASVYMDFAARDKKFDSFEDLVLQYKAEILVVLLIMLGIAVFAGSAMFPATMSLQTRGILAVIGLIGFGGIFFLYKGFEKLNPAIVLIIAQLNIFIMYFANVKFFDSGEQLSGLKIVFAVLFFLITAQFLLPGKKLSQEDKKRKFCIKSLLPDTNNLKINKFALYPILTAFCWAGFTFAFIYLNKTGTFTPIQSVFFTETAVGVFAFLALLFMKGKIVSFAKKVKKVNFKELKPYLLLGIFQIVGTIFFAYAYINSAANIVNVIRLFQIILTGIFAWVIFKQKLSKRNIALMGAAFVILLLFVFL